MSIALQIMLPIIFGSAVIMLASKTAVIETDASRWLLAIGVALLPTVCPMFDVLLLVDKTLGVALGAAFLVWVLGVAYGPARYQVIRGLAPMLIDARRSMYRMQAQMGRA